MKAILGTKKQMTQIFDVDGKVIPCTIIDVSEVLCVDHRTLERDGYQALILGIGKKKNPNKPMTEKFKQFGYVPEKIVEVRSEELSMKIGDKVSAEMFTEGELVDVIGTTKGMGFQGVIKLHGMKGGPKTHGQSTKHRSVGSIAPGQTYAHVMKGRRMARKMGNDKITVKNLKIVKIFNDQNLLLVKGAIPGTRGAKVLLKVTRF
jgi:large subunit ribosomal protein L3